jgi:hypothetical protein
LPVPVVIHVIAEVLRGLGYAHDLPVGQDVRGVVHRDVSPHNVLLSWEGAVKVSDFGIAKARAASEATASVFIKGKPAYMSPEQANGQALDGRSDLFAVGIMLWEMLVGRRLFVGADTRSTLAAVLFGQIPRPRSIKSDIPKDLERVVMKLLERDLPARYRSGEDAIRDLLACADAPKAGREALTAVLAERFPNEAKVRQSLARARAASLPDHRTSSPPGGIPAHAAPTVAGYAGAGHAGAGDVASLGSVMNAPTGTMDPAAIPRRPSKLVKALLVLGVTAGSAAITFAIVSAVRSKPPVAAARGSDAAAGSAPVTMPPDAVPQVAIADAAEPPEAGRVAAAPADAAVDAPKKDAPPVAPSEKKYGYLEVSGYFPVVSIYVDNQYKGDSPRTIKLTTGPHTIKLRSTDGEIDEKHPVTIKENETKHIQRK